MTTLDVRGAVDLDEMADYWMTAEAASMLPEPPVRENSQLLTWDEIADRVAARIVAPWDEQA